MKSYLNADVAPPSDRKPAAGTSGLRESLAFFGSHRDRSSLLKRGWAAGVCTCAIAGLALVSTAHAQFAHPGCLSAQEDLDRMSNKVAEGAYPWKGSWDKLVSNTNGWMSHTPEAVSVVYVDSSQGSNYIRLARDCARAYQLALRYHGSGDTAYADKAVQILNAWAAIHTSWDGNTNVSLRAGLYGYQFACAAELLRGYSGWSAADFSAFQNYMLAEFHPLNLDFLVRHHGTVDGHYWANWDLANLASMMAIGVLCDDQAIFDWAVDYFHNGAGTANLKNAVPYVHPNGLGQWQESGRDQGHSVMGPQLMGVICEIAWNQGIDLYGAQNNRFLASVEYISKYNLWQDVPFAPFVRTHGHPGSEKREVHWNVSSWGRGSMRPGWDLVYHHYVNRMGMDAPYTGDYASATRPEGGGFNHGGNSGGFDGLGFTTLTHSRDPIAAGTAPGGLRTTQNDWQVTLSWWGSAHAISYNVKRATASGGPFTTIATVGSQNSFYVDAGLTAGTTYHYAVSANTPAGVTADSAPASVTAIAAGGDSYQAEDATYGDGALLDDWTTGHHGTGYVVPMTTGYIEFTDIDGGAGGPATVGLRYALGSATRTGRLTVNGVPQDITADSTGDWDNWFERFFTVTLNSGTNNTLRIESDGTNNFVYVDELTVKSSTAAPTMAVPVAPGDLTASVTSTSRIDLSWNAVAGADSYNVKRAKMIGGPYVILDNQTGTTFADGGLGDSTTYHYVVTAINAAGESASSQISATTTTIPKFQEAGGVVSIEAENGLLGSRWLFGTDSGASNDSYIEVDPAYDWSGGAPEGTTGEFLAAYGFRISSPGNYRFWFRMLSNNAADDSFFWRIDGGSWILENNRYGGWFPTDTLQLDNLGAGDHLLEISYRENGTRLDKFVIQHDALTAPSGSGPSESSPADTTAPDAPAGLSATAGDGSVLLEWDDSTEPDFASYTVYRSTASGSGYALIASGLTASAYADDSVTNGTTYYYLVTATDTAANESGASGEASANPAALQPAASQAEQGSYGGGATVESSSGGFNGTGYINFPTSGGYLQFSGIDGAGGGDAVLSIRYALGAASSRTGVLIVNGVSQAITFDPTASWAHWAVKNITIPLNGGTTNTIRIESSGQDLANIDEIMVTHLLPSPWQSADVGAVAAAGSAAYGDGIFTVIGSGADIWGSADGFRHVYQTASGDCEIVARVTSVENTNNWAKAGVMIRESASANSRHASVVVTPAQGVSFQRRTSTGGASSSTTASGLGAPQWVRIVRSGDTFTAYRSVDGTSWTAIGAQFITMSTHVQIGLAVTSHNDGTLCTATFESVSVTP